MGKAVDRIIKLADFFVKISVDVHHSFLWTLSSLLNKQIYTENLDAWAEKNVECWDLRLFFID